MQATEGLSRELPHTCRDFVQVREPIQSTGYGEQNSHSSSREGAHGWTHYRSDNSTSNVVHSNNVQAGVQPTGNRGYKGWREIQGEVASRNCKVKRGTR